METNEVQDLYLNGEFLTLSKGRISIEDRGFLFADGVYEVVRFRGGRFLWLDEHVERLARSLATIEMPASSVLAELLPVLPELGRRSRITEGYAYIQITRGSAARDFLIPASSRPTVAAWMLPAQAKSWEEVLAGTRVATTADIRWSRCDIKSLMLLPAVLEKSRAAASGAAEIIWIGPDGDVREGGSSNIFALIGGHLLTHPADHRILNGVTRLKTLHVGREVGLEVLERPFSLDELMSAEEVFLTSTLRDILPILAVDGKPVGNGLAGRVTLMLAEALRRAVELDLGAGDRA